MLKAFFLLYLPLIIITIGIPIFSQDSKLTLVMTSCGRMQLLKQTIHSMFEYNDYPLRQMRIIDDCFTPEEQIWACIPTTADLKEHVKVIVNEEHLGQFRSIDRLYEGIKSKFVFHLEDDFVALPNNQVIQRGIELLEWAETTGEKISQVVFGRQLYYHYYRSELRTIPSNIGFFNKLDFPDHIPDFTMQPHISNYQLIYKNMLDSSIIKTIGPVCAKCLQNQRLYNMRCMSCFEPKLGKFLIDQGWYTVVLDDDRDDGGWEHAGLYGEHVSLTKRQSFWYYNAAILCAFGFQIFRLLRLVLLRLKSRRMEVQSEQELPLK